MIAVPALLLAAGALAGPATVARAQEDTTCVCPERLMDRLRALRLEAGPLVWSDRRARLGVLLSDRPDPATDSIGARIERVVPDGPADKAGLRAGDIITKLNDRSLLEGDESFPEGVSAPTQRLIARARQLEPGDTATVTYRRGRDTKTAKVVTGGDGLGLYDLRVAPLAPPAPRARALMERVEAMPHWFGAFTVGGAAGLDLAEMNAGLGEYFGTSEGVLVVDVPEDSPLGLQPGDVIESIGGREARDPDHVRRILRSYDRDEEISFEIVRKKKQMTVKGRLPRDTNGMWSGDRDRG
jgi:S1-C subfamily serine protease